MCDIKKIAFIPFPNIQNLNYLSAVLQELQFFQWPLISVQLPSHIKGSRSLKEGRFPELALTALCLFQEDFTIVRDASLNHGKSIISLQREIWDNFRH